MTISFFQKFLEHEGYPHLFPTCVTKKNQQKTKANQNKKGQNKPSKPPANLPKTL